MSVELTQTEGHVRQELLRSQRGAGEELMALALVVIQDLHSPRSMLADLNRAVKQVEQVLWERMGLEEEPTPPATETS